MLLCCVRYYVKVLGCFAVCLDVVDCSYDTVGKECSVTVAELSAVDMCDSWCNYQFCCL